jgi:tetratricopeptide (TPR) repeat protein
MVFSWLIYYCPNLYTNNFPKVLPMSWVLSVTYCPVRNPYRRFSPPLSRPIIKLTPTASVHTVTDMSGKRRFGRNKKKVQKRAPAFDKGKLREELSDPRKLQKQMNRLQTLLRTKPFFASLRLPPEPLAACLDDVSVIHADELSRMDGDRDQREFILSKVFGRFLTADYIRSVESTLMKYLGTPEAKPSNLKAVAAGLFFLEFHRKNPQDAARNPLWDILFTLSYEKMESSAGDTVREAAPPETSNQLKLPVVTYFGASDLTESEISLLSEAISLLESGQVELGFSLETILRGLRVHRESLKHLESKQKMQFLEVTYREEIGEREKADLLWGLSYAIDQTEGEKKSGFETVSEAIGCLPIRTNPVLFAMYCKCVMEFYRFLKADEIDAAHAILKSPDDTRPILAYARFLFNKEAPRRSLKAYEAALKQDPDCAIAALGAGIALWTTESYREARMFFDKSARFWRDNPEMVKISRSLQELNDHDELPAHVLTLLSVVMDKSS